MIRLLSTAPVSLSSVPWVPGPDLFGSLFERIGHLSLEMRSHDDGWT